VHRMERYSRDVAFAAMKSLVFFVSIIGKTSFVVYAVNAKEKVTTFQHQQLAVVVAFCPPDMWGEGKFDVYFNPSIVVIVYCLC